MDLTTVLGIVTAVALFGQGIASGEISPTMLNWHGLGIVYGGTAAAVLLNTPGRFIRQAFIAALGLLRSSSYKRPEEMVGVMVSLAEKGKGRGVSALREVDAGVAGGFLAHAARVVLERHNPEFVREVLEQEINQAADVSNEVTNVFRTIGLLTPMFGLIGTLLGIVNVLKDIANPEQVGHAMAVAITSAFYGIMTANLICIPISGKLRLRSWEETVSKSVVLEGVMMIIAGTVPAVMERKLQAFVLRLGD